MYMFRSFGFLFSVVEIRYLSLDKPKKCEQFDPNFPSVLHTTH